MKLNDSAVSIHTQIQDNKRAIALLNLATEIDTDYFTAYWNKMIYLGELKDYEHAADAAKEAVRIRPQDPMRHLCAGQLYDKLGDSATAKNYYQKALVLYNSILDTMNRNNRQYSFTTMLKGLTLILNGDARTGNAILKQLYDKEADPSKKTKFGEYLGKSREEILDFLD